MYKSIDDINERIHDGSVRVVTAEEMPDIVDELGVSGALREVDVVTTGTFGAMCSSGAFLNFGHPEIPIRMEKMWLNNVEAYAGIAAVDCYLGATQRVDQLNSMHVPRVQTVIHVSPSPMSSHYPISIRPLWSTRGTPTSATTQQQTWETMRSRPIWDICCPVTVMLPTLVLELFPLFPTILHSR